MEQKPKRGRPKTENGKKPQSIYATDDQAEYMRWWVKEKGIVPPKPWTVKK